MCAAAMDPSKSTVHGPGLSKADAGIPAVLQIKAMDCYGNRRTTGAHPAPQNTLPSRFALPSMATALDWIS